MGTKLMALMDLFRFIRNARERRRQEEAALREHTLELLDTVLSKVQAQNETTAAAMVEMAKASKAHAEALNTWFEMFKANNEMAHVGSVTVRGEDLWEEERAREHARLLAAGYPVNSSAAEQLAWLQSHGNQLPI
jgi:DNA-binding protein H-NS